jgi:hypothetical protein
VTDAKTPLLKLLEIPNQVFAEIHNPHDGGGNRAPDSSPVYCKACGRD